MPFCGHSLQNLKLITEPHNRSSNPSRVGHTTRHHNPVSHRSSQNPSQEQQSSTSDIELPEPVRGSILAFYHRVQTGPSPPGLYDSIHFQKERHSNNRKVVMYRFRLEPRKINQSFRSLAECPHATFVWLCLRECFSFCFGELGTLKPSLSRSLFLSSVFIATASQSEA